MKAWILFLFLPSFAWGGPFTSLVNTSRPDPLIENRGLSQLASWYLEACVEGEDASHDLRSDFEKREAAHQIYYGAPLWPFYELLMFTEEVAYFDPVVVRDRFRGSAPHWNRLVNPATHFIGYAWRVDKKRLYVVVYLSEVEWK